MMRSLLVFGSSLVMVAGCANVVDSSGKDLRPPPPSFEDFERDTYVDPRGIYIVDGDIPVLDDKRLHVFYDDMIADYEASLHKDESQKEEPLALATQAGQDITWTATQKMNLTYCVSPTFGSAKQTQVIQAMADATNAWENAIQIHFVHVASEDANCGQGTNNNVVFDVNPVNANGQFIASSFFPNSPRSARSIVIDPSGFTTQAPLTLTGVLRHELGHVIGFRHEHTRPEAGGVCFEDNNWRPLTPYDSASVMHYPQCNGTGDWSLTLTDLDKQGAASVYGAAGSTPPPPPSGNAKTQSFNGNVAQGATTQLGQFAVVAGSTFTATMTGTGDPDLYVQFGAQPTLSSYACRPYVNGPSETCTLTVPAGATTAFVAVNGYATATYTVNVSWTEPDGASSPPPSNPPPSNPPPSTGTQQTSTFSGSVAKGKSNTTSAINVVPGTSFVATMTGTGDPDLYVRFGAAPTTTSYACRPYINGPSETCQLTVPAGQTTAFVMVRGFTAATYNVSMTYTTP